MTVTVEEVRQTTKTRSWPERLHLYDYSGAYALVVLIVVYSIALPNVFPTFTTLRTILSDQSITGILAIAAIVPFVAGLIDISFASLAGFSLVLMTWLSTNTQLGFFGGALVAILATVALGTVSGLMIAVLKLDSLIVTLGISTLALGLSEGITRGDTIVGSIDQNIVDAIQGTIGPIPVLAIAFVALALVVYVCLEHTVLGRNLHAVGSNPLAARLAGINVVRYRFSAMIFAAVISSVAGILLAAKIGSAASVTGSAYLLPALAIIFFGSTQIHRGVNVPGILLATAVIGTLIKGLQLAGVQSWVSPLANGLILLLALAMTSRAARRADQLS